MLQILFVIPWTLVAPYVYGLLGIAIVGLVITWRITKNPTFLGWIAPTLVVLVVAWFLTERVGLKEIPIYGYGLMLFLAYLFCTALGKYLCKRQGIDPKVIPDLAIWFFV